MRFFLIVMLIASTIFSQKALADSNCMPIYGGGASCTTGNLAIEKDVVNPVTNSDVHDLGINDPTFSSGQAITFHITITNISSTMVSSATVQDAFPQFLNFQNGPGTFNSRNSELTFQIGNIAPGASQTFTITGTVADASKFPSTSITCMSNTATVTQNNVSAQDTSQFCVRPTGATTSNAFIISPTPPVVPGQIATSPATGPSNLWLGLIPLGTLGYGLSKLAGKGAARGN